MSSEKAYPCEVCGRVFSRKFNLQRHTSARQCTAFSFPTEHTYYTPLIKSMLGAMHAPISDSMVPHVWKCTCICAHASPQHAFDVFWNLLRILTPKQLVQAYALDHQTIQPPTNLPMITHSIAEHLRKLQEKGVQSIGKSSIDEVMQALPNYSE